MQPIVVAVCLAGLAAGTYTDLRTREVPDWINYALIFSGLGIAGIYSLAFSAGSFFIESLTGLAVCFAIAMLMYYTGQWGGGDSKMIMGLGALIGLKAWPLEEWLFVPPFLLTFMAYTLIVGAVYGLAWSAALAYRHRKSFLQEFRKNNSRKDIRMGKKIMIAVIAAGLAGSFFVPADLRFLLLSVLLLAAATLYLFIFIKSVEKCCMLKRLTPERLTPGDWIAEEVKIKGKLICGPKDLGITKEQIDQLLKHRNQVRSVLVKEGVPFVPSFLIAFILTWALGGGLFLRLFQGIL